MSLGMLMFGVYTAINVVFVVVSDASHQAILKAVEKALQPVSKPKRKSDNGNQASQAKRLRATVPSGLVTQCGTVIAQLANSGVIVGEFDDDELAPRDDLEIQTSSRFFMTHKGVTWLEDLSVEYHEDKEYEVHGLVVPETVVLIRHKRLESFVVPLVTMQFGTQYYRVDSGLFTVKDWNLLVQKFVALDKYMPDAFDVCFCGNGHLTLYVSGDDLDTLPCMSYDFVCLGTASVADVEKTMQPVRFI